MDVSEFLATDARFLINSSGEQSSPPNFNPNMILNEKDDIFTRLVLPLQQHSSGRYTAGKTSGNYIARFLAYIRAGAIT